MKKTISVHILCILVGVDLSLLVRVVVIDRLRLEKHLVENRVLWQVCDLDIEDVLASLAVGAAHNIFHDFKIEKLLSHQISREIHARQDQNLLCRSLQDHIGNDGCKHSRLTRTWRTLDERDPLLASIDHRLSLTFVELRHAESIYIHLKLRVAIQIGLSLRSEDGVANHLLVLSEHVYLLLSRILEDKIQLS